jgi:hypothetical protein
MRKISRSWRRRGWRPGRGRAARLVAEALEDRFVPSTFTVVNLADEGAGSLRDAVALADANPGPDLIDFAPGVQGTITLTSGELFITDDLTIDGPGADVIAVSGNDASRVFDVIGPFDGITWMTSSISGLTINHGHELQAGGGIVNAGGSDLTLSHVVLSNNVAFSEGNNSASGGGVENYARLRVLDSVLVDNRADMSAGVGGSSSGGAIDSAGETLTIRNCTIKNNQAISGFGAPFESPFAFGGGIMVIAGQFLLADSTVTGNQAVAHAATYAFGGGIDIASATAQIVRTTIAGNQAITGATADNGRPSAAEGGGVTSFNSTTALTRSVFHDNRVVAAAGGRADGGAILNERGHLLVDTCVLSGNQAVGGSLGSGTNPDITDVGGAHGGAIANLLQGDVVVRDSTITLNRATGGSGNRGGGPLAFVGAAAGGGIYNAFGPNVTSVPVAPTTLTVVRSEVRNNVALGGNNNGAVSSAAFVGAGLGGGIANLLGGTADLISSVVSGNQALGGEGDTAEGGSVPPKLAAGGGVFNALGNLGLSTGVVLPPSVVTVRNSRLAGNRATGGEGLAAVRGGDGWGGAVAAMFDATTRIVGTALVANGAVGGTSFGGPGGNGFGGGAFNDTTSTLALSTSLVTRNQALGGSGGSGGSPGTGVGGGAYNLGRLALDAVSLVIGNFASTSNNDIFG